jgi:hypothetical protein
MREEQLHKKGTVHLTAVTFFAMPEAAMPGLRII